MEAKKIISIVIASLLVIVVAVLSVYVVFFKERENSLEYSQTEYNKEKNKSLFPSQEDEKDEIDDTEEAPFDNK